MATHRLQQSVDDAALSLLNQIDRDPYSQLGGCCDRRFWGWKLVDFPDATLQRAVQPLAWMLTHAPGSFPVPDAAVADAVVRALTYLEAIQHTDGSFDQAYPQEHSVAGTAFILDSAIVAMTVVEQISDPGTCQRIRHVFERAAGFLCRQNETHGAIANHVAGSILALLRAEQLLGRREYGVRAAALLDALLATQSSEGWFPEYGGCDPGYLSLCVYYLAQVATVRPSDRLRSSLERAVTFLSHFVHPDGTFGGVYGSRRTTVYYAGGIALLAHTLPLAARMTTEMLRAAEERRLLGPGHSDIGNSVPVLANYQLALDAMTRMSAGADVPLPYEAGRAVDFPEAGIYLRASASTWTIVGASNGGTVAVWDRPSGRRIHDDGGWVAEASDHRWTTQVTMTRPVVESAPDRVRVVSQFHQMTQPVPSVPAFVGLRLAGLALRCPAIGARVKRLLVRLLLTAGKAVDAQTERTIALDDDEVVIRDALTGDRAFWRGLTQLGCGRPFSAIHMASAGYVVHVEQLPQLTTADLTVLASVGALEVRVRVSGRQLRAQRSPPGNPEP